MVTILNDAQMDALLTQLAEVRGIERVHLRDARRLLNEANAARGIWMLFELTIRGRLLVDVVDGELKFLLPEQVKSHRREQGYVKTSASLADAG